VSDVLTCNLRPRKIIAVTDVARTLFLGCTFFHLMQFHNRGVCFVLKKISIRDFTSSKNSNDVGSMCSISGQCVKSSSVVAHARHIDLAYYTLTHIVTMAEEYFKP